MTCFTPSTPSVWGVLDVFHQVKLNTNFHRDRIRGLLNVGIIISLSALKTIPFLRRLVFMLKNKRWVERTAASRRGKRARIVLPPKRSLEEQKERGLRGNDVEVSAIFVKMSWLQAQFVLCKVARIRARRFIEMKMQPRVRSPINAFAPRFALFDVQLSTGCLRPVIFS